MEQEKKWYAIYGGLGSTMGGTNLKQVLFCTEEIANELAYEYAAEEYEGYAGLYGLRDTDQIMEEDECDYDEAYETYVDERESWLDYWIRDIETEIDEEHSDYEEIQLLLERAKEDNK